MSSLQVLYIGDTSLASAASYLAGLMMVWDMPFDYVPSDRKLEPPQAQAARKLFILSDYPAAMLDGTLAEMIVQQIRDGAGLLMLGGWESYRGKTGHWAGTKIAEALPVEIGRDDDRVNCDQPALAVKTQDHAITRNLPWDERPPTIGGYNRITPRTGTQTLLEVQRFRVQRISQECSSFRETPVATGISWHGRLAHAVGTPTFPDNGSPPIGERFEFTPDGRDPLLVVGEYGKGRTAALATDVAPHWIGGMVDWGTGRVEAEAAPGAGTEVGSHYAAFFRQLLTWTGRLEP